MTRFLLAAILAAALALAGCGGGDDESTPANPPAAPTSAESQNDANAKCEAWQDAGGKGSVTIKAPDGNVTCVGADR